MQNDIVRLGNISTGDSQCGQVYGIDGPSMTICAGHHGYCFGYILENLNKVKLTIDKSINT